MKRKFFVLLLSSFFLAACASSNSSAVSEQEQTYDMHDASVALSEAAVNVSQTLDQLSATEQAANPPRSLSTPPNPASYGMGMKASIDWNGPVKPIVQQIANATNYKLQVLGKESSIPLVVSINSKNEAMGNILQNIGYQCGKQATITVFPSRRIIQLRYANI